MYVFDVRLGNTDHAVNESLTIRTSRRLWCAT